MGTLIGKRALVTGGGQGIGKAVAEGLLKAGCDIAIHYRTGEDGARDLVGLAKSLGRKAVSFQADLTDETAAIKLVIDAVTFLGGLDVLINNVGGLVERRFLEKVDLAFWNKVIALNMTTMMVVTREAVPHLAQGRTAPPSSTCLRWPDAKAATPDHSFIR